MHWLLTVLMHLMALGAFWPNIDLLFPDAKNIES